MKRKTRRFGVIHKSVVITLVALSSVLTLSDKASESSAEYSSSVDAYASLKMYNWVPYNVTTSANANAGQCVNVSWMRPDDAITEYNIGISKNADFSNRVIDQWIVSSEAKPQAVIKGLELNTTYYMRVYAVNPWNWEWSHVVHIFKTTTKSGTC